MQRGWAKESSDSTWVMQLWAHTFTPYLTENAGAGTGFSKEGIPQEYCLEFFSYLPLGEIHKSFSYLFPFPCHLGKWAAFCARAMLLCLYLLSWAISCPTKLCYKDVLPWHPRGKIFQKIMLPIFWADCYQKSFFPLLPCGITTCCIGISPWG